MCQLDRQLLQQINTNKTIKDIFLICRSIYSFWSAESELPGSNPRKVMMKNFVCPSERDPASPPQHPAIPTIAGLAARRTDSFRVRSGICRADQTVGNRNGDTGHCSRGPKARKRFAPYSKGFSPAWGELKI